MDGIGLFFGFFWLIWLVAMLIGIAGFVFWIFMLIDVIQRENWKNDDEKTVWLLVVILANWVGALIYYFVIKQKYDQKKPQHASK